MAVLIGLVFLIFVLMLIYYIHKYLMRYAHTNAKQRNKQINQNADKVWAEKTSLNPKISNHQLKRIHKHADNETKHTLNTVK